jgi:type IV pilus assembly protein PilC
MAKPTATSKLTGKFNFSYTARDFKNRKVKGEILAENVTTARVELRKKGLINVKLKLMKDPSFIAKFFARKKVKARDITIFTRQLATMQTAGIPLVQGLRVIIESSEKPSMSKLINKLKDEVESGGSLSECLRLHPQEFDELYCNLVTAGENSGNLEVMLQRIATYREKTETLKGKLKKAMYYPIAVLAVAFIVTGILLVKVVPTFRTMFEGFGAKLPAFTLFVLNVSDAIRANGVKVVFTVCITAWFTVRMYRNQPTFRNFVQRLFLKTPIFGKIFQKAAVARFARTLSTTFAAGVPLPDALLLVAKSSGNIKYHNAIIKIRDEVSVGKRINVAMQATNVFPHMVVQMVAIGEETGSLDSMLQKVAAIYEEEVDLAVDGLATLLEPIIMVLLGVIVGGLVIAMYLPIFKLGSVM